MLKKLRCYAFLCAMAFCLVGSAQSFQSGDLYYTILSATDKTVELSRPSSSTNYTLTDVVVPATVAYNGENYTVTTIGYQCFYFAEQLNSLVLPNTIKTIKGRAFFKSSLRNLTLPEGLEELQKSAFDSSNITSAVIPASVKSIGENVYYDCPLLEEITILAPLKELPKQFYRCYNSGKCGALTKITLPSTLEKLGEGSISYSRITSIELPAGLKTIEKNALTYSVSLMSLNIPASVETIGSNAFEQCISLKEVTIPGSVKWNGDSQFKYCDSVEKLIIEEGIETLPNYFISRRSFGSNVPLSLKYVSLPSTLKSMGNGSLDGSIFHNDIEIVIAGNNVIDITENTFGYNFNLTGAYEKATITVEPDMVATYKAHDIWKNFAKISEPYTETPENFLNVLGEGGSYASFTMNWSDSKAIDNLTSAVRFSGSTTADELIASAMKADSRYYALKDNVGNFVAFGFDTNGDKSAAVKVNDADATLTDGVAVASEAITSVAAGSQFDHWQINSDDSEWVVYINGKKAAMTDAVKLADNVVLAYVGKDAEAPVTTDVFYLRPETQRGVWMASEILFDTANGKQQYFPIISNMITTTDLYGVGVSFEVLDREGNNSTAMSIYLADAKNGGCSARLTASLGENVVIKPFFNTRPANEVVRIYTDTPTTLTMNVAHPVTGIKFTGWPEGNINLYDMFGFRAVVEPEDADFPTIVYQLNDERAAEIYARSSYEFDHFFAHNTGRYSLTASTPDGKISVKKDFTILDRDRNIDTEFTDGTFWLNEEWFGHSNGSINYVRPDGTVLTRAYEFVNPYEGFGCTSQYATIYADKLIVMSKQYKDGGDPRTGGGRLTVADACTLEKLASFDDLGNGDGRACVGVNPKKAYIGAASGIGVLNLEDFSYDAAGIADMPTGGNTYSSQYGDMVASGNYVFAVRQGSGLIIIDAVNDKYVKTVENSNIQGVARTADGNVWYVDYNRTDGSKIYCINPETLEVEKTYAIPGAISCEWGSWRSTRFFAAKRSNKLFWGVNYCWDMDKDETPENVTPIITSEDERWPMTVNEKKQGIYGSATYDDRTNEILWSGNQGYGTDGRFTWYNYTNVETGDIRSIRVTPDYYYFPAIPVVPDKYLPALAEENFAIEFKTTEEEGQKFELTDIIDDLDNSPAMMHFTLSGVEHRVEVEEAETLAEEDEAEEKGVVSVEFDGKTITVAPLAYGEAIINIETESNGRIANVAVPVVIKKETTPDPGTDPDPGKDPEGAVETITDDNGSVFMQGNNAVIDGMAGCTFNIYDVNGCNVYSFPVMTDHCAYHLHLSTGVYVMVSDNGQRFKIMIK